MFGDPITITQSSVDFVFPRVGLSANGAQYTTADRLRSLNIAHSRTGSGSNVRLRHEARLDFSEIGADPFVSGVNHQYTGSVYLVINLPDLGSSITTADAVSEFDKLQKFLNASSNGNLTRLIQGES
jgi:hypothetical protein